MKGQRQIDRERERKKERESERERERERNVKKENWKVFKRLTLALDA